MGGPANRSGFLASAEKEYAELYRLLDEAKKGA